MKRRRLSVIIGLIIVMVIAIFGNICKIRKVEVAFDKDPVSCSAVEIFEKSQIKMGSSILSLNENVVKKNVMDAYEENLVAVTDIVRVFPNKIVIHCVEHAPMVAVSVKGESDVYAIADGDFQLDKKVAKSEVDLDSLILIEGVEVDDTYNTPTFRIINDIFKAFENEGLDYNAQAKFIKTLTFGVGEVTIFTRDNKTLSIDYDTIGVLESVKSAYSTYISNQEF
ncbi:MAG: FtsQ-type POTRA domain-containing protein [Clostridia bacterium]|nr:FtsQ-type POTRA domain-containing protein [Clostridia bacterium]